MEIHPTAPTSNRPRSKTLTPEEIGTESPARFSHERRTFYWTSRPATLLTITPMHSRFLGYNRIEDRTMTRLGTASRLFASVLLWTIALSASAQEKVDEVVGDWTSLLKVNDQRTLELVFHIKSSDNGLIATMDSPDEGIRGIPFNEVEWDDGRLLLVASRIGARYEGTFVDQNSRIEGTWSQAQQSYPLDLERSASEVIDERPEQVWEGAIQISDALQIRVLVRVQPATEGLAASATLDVPDQGARGLKIQEFKLAEDAFSGSLTGINTKISGTFNDDRTGWDGTWTQNGRTFPLTLERVESETPTRRPQTPKPPFPYDIEEVSYRNDDADITIAGTLTLPKPRTARVPAALLVTGSGPQDRDETLFNHKIFWVIADALTRRGIAVLRVDDRGVGGTGGDPSSATSFDYVDDALAGITYLKGRPEVDPGAIGLIGHSEGGLIGPIAAARSEDIGYLVLLAGPGIPGDQTIRLQTRKGMSVTAMDPENVEDIGRAIDRAIELTMQGESTQEIVEQLKSMELDEGIQSLISGLAEQFDTPWFKTFLKLDPRDYLTQVRCPVLAINGAKDVQVLPEENIEEIAKALAIAPTEDVTTRILPGLNHLFQNCETGSAIEYGQIEETFAPDVLDLMAEWINQRFGVDGSKKR